MPLNYFENFLIFVSVANACASLGGVAMSITISAVRLIICAITAGIKMYKSILKKNKKKHDKTALLPKTKLNTIKVLISKALFGSYISHDKFCFNEQRVKRI